jgi:phosphoribosylformylglycinamidine cyclo-ligase
MKIFKGLAHITGSGFLNVPRMSDQVSYEIHLPIPVERPPIFQWVRAQSGLSLEELAKTFNLGLGMVGVVSASDVAETLKKLEGAGEKAWEVGQVIARRSASSPRSEVKLSEVILPEVILYDDHESVTLS